ncbi:alpha/beta fold hydrolase [Gordonia sp. NPDC003424]
MHRLINRILLVATVLMCAIGFAVASATPSAQAAPRPTIVLVHGAFADKTSWDGVAAILRNNGYHVVAVDNPLRSPLYDASVVEQTIHALPGPIVLVGHSYGGAVISNVHDRKVTRLVYVAAFGPAQGEPISLAINPLQFPGSQLVPPVLQVKVVADPRGVGGYTLDGYIEPSSFKRVFAQDVSDATAANMIAHQRSIAVWTNLEPNGPPSWASTPSWYVVSANDRVIPPDAERYMAKRMRAHTTEIQSSHASLVAHPDAVSKVILQAAA